MIYLLDTNILLYYLRKHCIAEIIEQKYAPFDYPNTPVVSVVTIGEIKSIALQNRWGTERCTMLEEFLKQLLITDINSEDVIQRYAEIDAFSQGRLAEKTLPSGISSRNMGKNDLWIAATASVISAILITTDNDFSHLKPNFLSLELIQI